MIDFRERGDKPLSFVLIKHIKCMYKVLITHYLPYEGLKLLYENFNVVIPDKGNISEELLYGNIADCDAILCTYAFKVTKDIIDKSKQLKIIANFGVGYDNIDVEYAQSKHICVTNAPGIATEYTSELAMALMLDIARKIKENDSRIRKNNGVGVINVMENLAYTLYGKTLGLIGIGNIAKAVVKRAKPFGMKVIYNSRNRLDIEKEKDLCIEWRNTVEEVIKESDFISLHIPADNNKYLIDDNEFRKMKSNAVIINTARGTLINEKALINALKEKLILGAALDVYENEKQINPELLHLDNVLLSPHNGTGTVEARIQSAEKASRNIYNYFYGNKDELNLV